MQSNFKSVKPWLIRTGILLICFLPYVAYGLVYKQTIPGNHVFQIGYSLPITRGSFLQFYHWSLREHGGYSLPTDINEFLLKRLADSTDRQEWEAILDFYISMDSSRWHKTLLQLPDSLKKQIINNIFVRLDKFDSRQATHALFLIESLRTGSVPYKGGFSNIWMYNKDNGKFDLNTKQFKIVKKSFHHWWADGSKWPDNKNVSPLSGTGTKIIGP
jgi:hypothetical protein